MKTWFKRKPSTPASALASFEFAPRITLAKVDGKYLLHFDSNHQADTGRIVYMLPIGSIENVMIAVEGFAEDATVRSGTDMTIHGDVVITSGMDSHAIPLVLRLQGAVSAEGAFSFPAPDHIRSVVRNGVAREFTKAVERFIAAHDETRLATYAAADIGAPLAKRAVSAVTETSEADDARKRKMFLIAAFVGPVVAVLLLWALGAGQQAANPYEEAFKAAMAQDPVAIESQVNLTKQTLKDMGLDPGQAGDMGCMAPQ